jgi:hypothetical protein
MNLLGAANYDPVGGAVTKATTSLIAMTAFDATNLRVAFTVPSHGMVHVRMSCVHHGATTIAQLFLGCLEGATLRGRAAPSPMILGTSIAAALVKLEVAFTITGLTPGAVNWDAAYGVETVANAGGIKYGGANNTSGNDAFGGFNFEIWDPRPFGVTQTAGDIVALINAVDDLVDTEVAAIKTETASIQADTNDIQTRLPAALVSGRIDASVGAMAANVLTATAINADAITAAKVAADVTTEIQSGLATAAALATVQADTDNIQTRLPAALSGDGFMKADLKSIEDELTSGNNAILRLKGVHIFNPAGGAVDVLATGGPAINVFSDDYPALRLKSTDDEALHIESQNGYGAYIYGDTGIVCDGNVNEGILVSSFGLNKDALKLIASGTGKSINAPNDIGLPSGDLDDQLQALPTATWASGTRTLTSFGTLVADIWANATRTLTAISDSAGVTTLLSRIASALNITSGKVESNVKQINDTNITGDGSGTPWGPA